jgi:hypothetical protein
MGQFIAISYMATPRSREIGTRRRNMEIRARLQKDYILQ